MNAKTRKELLAKITEATSALESTPSENTGSLRFHYGFRFGLIEAAELVGISYDEIVKAQDTGAIKAKSTISQ